MGNWTRYQLGHKPVTTSDVVSAEDFGTLRQLLPNLSDDQVRLWQHELDEAADNAERYTDIEAAEKAPEADQLVTIDEFSVSEYEPDGTSGEYGINFGFDPHAYADALSQAWYQELDDRATLALSADHKATSLPASSLPKPIVGVPR